VLRNCPETFHQVTLTHDVCLGPPFDKDWELQCDVITDLQTVLEMFQSSISLRDVSKTHCGLGAVINPPAPRETSAGR
jgi:hypothetical protein